jgi:ABC-type sugar transport system ATPase subunit
MSNLVISGLCLRAGSFAITDFSLRIDGHRYFVLMGPTGSGKTLVLKAICGLIKPRRGTITLDGIDITRMEPRQRGIGYVPQDSGLFPHLDVRRNVAFPVSATGSSRKAADSRIDEIVASLEIAHLLQRSVVNLSGGEKQKVALARALARQPRLLILDEPISALDEPARNELCRLLRRVQAERDLTTLHVCHNREEARMAGGAVGVMSEGRLLEVGPLDELEHSSSNPEVRRLLGQDG